MKRLALKYLFALTLTLAPYGFTHADISDYYNIETIDLPEGVAGEVGGIDVLPNGKVAVCFFREGVWFYDPKTKQWSHFAYGLHEPLGIHAVSESEVVVMQRPELTRIKDTNNDGKADHFQTITDDFGMSGNYHEFAYGPTLGPDGNYYVSLNTASSGDGVFKEVRGQFNKTGRPGRMYSCVPYRGWILKVTPEGKVTPFASGFRSPNGIGFDKKGRLYATDNQGDWIGTSPFCHVIEGCFYGHVSSLVWRPGFEGDPLKMQVKELMAIRTPPAVQFPHGAMANSPTQPICDTTDGKFGPFAGQMLVGEMNHKRIMRVMLEVVAGHVQGAVVPFYDNAGLSGGVNRIAFAPDHSLWVGHTKRDGGWGGGRGIHRITWNGKTPLDVLKMNLTEQGFDLTFTKPIDAASIKDASAFQFTRYFYEYHRGYGSKQFDVTKAPVKTMRISDDGRKVSLSLEKVKPGYVYELKINGLRSAQGEALVNNYIVYNVNRLLDGTTDQPQFKPLPPPKPIEPVTMKGKGVVIEAENAQLRGPSVQRNNQGFTGKGFADFKGNTAEWIEWRIEVKDAGQYQAAFRYALEGGERPLRLKVNNAIIATAMPFKATGGWTTWKPLTTSITLKQGINLIRLEATGKSGPNIDHLELKPYP